MISVVVVRIRNIVIGFCIAQLVMGLGTNSPSKTMQAVLIDNKTTKCSVQSYKVTYMEQLLFQTRHETVSDSVVE